VNFPLVYKVSKTLSGGNFSAARKKIKKKRLLQAFRGLWREIGLVTGLFAKKITL
jgi:hypothetical protein